MKPRTKEFLIALGQALLFIAILGLSAWLAWESLKVGGPMVDE